MGNTIKLEIATPEAMVYSADVEMVTLPGIEGQMGVLPQHVRLMTQLVPGEMIVHRNGHDEFPYLLDGAPATIDCAAGSSEDDSILMEELPQC